jgi:glycosyltransferase involved in cell wall biosynthesis
MTRVTLCVDALTPGPGGIGRYTWELCKRIGGHDGIDELRFFGRGRLLDDPGRLLRDEPLLRPPNKLRRWWDRRSVKRSLVHGPNYFLPSFAETGVITIHDLSVFRYPETHPADRVLAFEREFERSLDRAAHVITDTETVRAELIESFSVRPDRVTAVLLGVDPAFRPQAAQPLAPTLRSWGLEEGKYGLCVSTLEPRKKISELLAAWRRLPRATRDLYPLVLCGGAGWRNEALQRQVEDGVAEGWLRHLGFVPEAQLPQLYAGAAIFIYPSIYEGFGLPPLEALASGVPVMVSGRSCLPEVCGDAARYFDPDDAEGLTTAIAQNLADEEWRAESLQRGLDRARQFSWDRCTDSTVAIYRQVVSTSLDRIGD